MKVANFKLTRGEENGMGKVPRALNLVMKAKEKGTVPRKLN
jgi:hypothetical protein